MELLVVDVVEVGVVMFTCAGQHGERWELIDRQKISRGPLRIAARIEKPRSDPQARVGI